MKPEFMDDMERPPEDEQEEGMEGEDEISMSDIEEMPEAPDIDLSEIPDELLQAELDRRAAGASESGKPGEEDVEGYTWGKQVTDKFKAPFMDALNTPEAQAAIQAARERRDQPMTHNREQNRTSSIPTSSPTTASLNKSQQSAVPQVAAMPSPLKPIATPVPTPVTKPTVVPPQEVTGSEVQTANKAKQSEGKQYALAPTQPAPAPTRMQGGPAFGSMWSRLKSAMKKK